MKFLFFLFTASIFAQPTMEWQNTIGGNNMDVNSIILEIPENQGYLVGGSSLSGISGDKTENTRGSWDIWIIKIDNQNNILWQKTIGGSNEDVLAKIFYTNDGGFILGCSSNSNISGEKTENSKGGNDYWIIKLDSLGTIEWQKTIGGNGSDALSHIEQTNDNGYILCGGSNSNISGDKTENRRDPLVPTGLITNDYWIIKLNSTGIILWQKTIGGNDNDFPAQISQTTDGGYIVGGKSLSNISYEKSENSRGNYDFWILKLDVFGEIEWQKTIGGNMLEDYFGGIIFSSDNGYQLGGLSFSGISGDKSEESRGGGDIWLIKLNNNGTIVWQKTIGGSDDDYCSSINKTTNNNLLISSHSYSDISGEKSEESRGLSDLWLLEIDTLGNIVWQKTFGGENYESNPKLIHTEDNGYIVSCSSNSNISGDKNENSTGLSDFWIIKLSTNNLNTTSYTILTSYSPNPFNSELTITTTKNLSNSSLKIYNSIGQLVKKVENIYGNKVILQRENLVSGIYFVQLFENDKMISSQKIIIKD